jgi:hypothetical protein
MTAQALGLMVANWLLAIADEVIEWALTSANGMVRPCPCLTSE